MTGVVPDVRLNNGTSIAAGRFRRLPGARRRNRTRGARRDRSRLPQHRHGLAVRQRGRGRAGGRRLRAAARGAVRHHQALERRPGLRQHAPGLRREPAPARPGLRRPLPDPLAEAGLDRYVETWRAFETLAADGRARAIGVSNFQIAHLQRLLDETEVVPAVNQIELHPRLQQEPLRRFHAEHGIVTEAWSPLGQGQALQRSGGRGARPAARPHARAGRAAVAPAAGQRGDPEVGHAVADPGEHRAVRLRTGRRGHGRARGAGGRRPAGPRPRRARHTTPEGLLQHRRSVGSRTYDKMKPDLGGVGARAAGTAPERPHHLTRGRYVDELVAAGHALSRAGLVTAFGHVSCRVADDRLLITPPMPLGRLTPESAWTSCTSTRTRCPPVCRGRRGSTWRSRGDDRTSGRSAGPATGGDRAGLRRGADRAAARPGRLRRVTVPVFDDAVLIRDRARAEALADRLGQAPALLLRGNGAVTVGADVGEAVARMWVLEASARMNCVAAAAGTPVRCPTTSRPHGGTSPPSSWPHLARPAPGRRNSQS